jgi:DNA-binding transcriptional LysR family regulator
MFPAGYAAPRAHLGSMIARFRSYATEMPRSKVTIEQVRAFVAVAETHSYSEAQDRLNLRGPEAVRHLVARLETALGLGQAERLFRADYKGNLRLTHRGQLLLSRAEKFLLAAEELGVYEPYVRIGAYPSIALRLAEHLPAHLPEHAFDNLSDATRSDGGATLLRRLEAGHLDLVIAPSGWKSAGLAERRLYQWLLRAVFTGSDQRGAPRTMSLSDLRNRPVLLSPIGHGSRQVLDRACVEDGIELNIAMELAEQHVMRALALANSERAWTAVMPDDTFGEPHAELGPALVTGQGHRLASSYSLYHRGSKSDLNEDVRAMAEAIVALLADESAPEEALGPEPRDG